MSFQNHRHVYHIAHSPFLFAQIGASERSPFEAQFSWAWRLAQGNFFEPGKGLAWPLIGFVQ